MTTDFEGELNELQALTDTTFARLGVDELLDELLDRVRDILDADTAAVLLVSEGSGELEREPLGGSKPRVRQGVRVPLGTGFAGRIASTREPILLERVDATTVSNPILWEQGIKVMLGVPLLTGDRLIGVLHVGRLAERPFDRATPSCSEWSPHASPRQCTRASSSANRKRRCCSSGASSPRGRRTGRGWRSRLATSAPSHARWEETGTTCSSSRRASTGSSSATSRATDSARRS